MTKLVLAPHVTVTEAEHGSVILDERSGSYWQTNATGALVVRCLAEDGDPQRVVDELGERFPAAASQVAGDVAALVRQLRDAGLVIQT